MKPLVSIDLPSQYPCHFEEKCYFNNIPAVGEQAEVDRCPSHTAILNATEGPVSSENE